MKVILMFKYIRIVSDQVKDDTFDSVLLIHLDKCKSEYSEHNTSSTPKLKDAAIKHQSRNIERKMRN